MLIKKLGKTLRKKLLKSSSNTLPLFTHGGIVEHNRGRGSDLGFPTANISAPDNQADGIYAGWVEQIDNEVVHLPAALFIGPAITYGETKRMLEVHILDTSLDLYGKSITVQAVQYIRGNKAFANDVELQAAISKDIEDITLCLQV